MSETEQTYRLATDIYQQHSFFFKERGITNLRTVANSHEIFSVPEEHFVHQKKSKTGFVKCEKDVRGAKLYISQKWIDENISGVSAKRQQNRERITQTIAHLRKQACQVSGIYLFSLGNVKELRSIFQIPDTFADDFMVCKYGKSENIDVRAEQHLANYGMMPNVEMDLEFFVPVDKSLLTNAENATKDWFISKKYKITNQKYTEIVAFPQSFLEKVKVFYSANCKKHGKELQSNVSVIKDLQIKHVTAKKVKAEKMLKLFKEETDEKIGELTNQVSQLKAANEKMMEMMEAMMGKLCV